MRSRSRRSAHVHAEAVCLNLCREFHRDREEEIFLSVGVINYVFFFTVMLICREEERKKKQETDDLFASIYTANES